MHTMVSNSFVELTQRLIEASKNWARRRASANEVTSFNSEELSCIAHELGISAAELRVLANHDKNAQIFFIGEWSSFGSIETTSISRCYATLSALLN